MSSDTGAVVASEVPTPSARRGLGRRIAWGMAGLAVALLAAAGALESVFAYREARDAIARQQLLQARGALGEIEQYLQTTVAQLARVQALPWGEPGFGPATRREELHRLMALSPAVLSIVDADQRGHERLAVSRELPDRRDDGRWVGGPAVAGAVLFGAPVFTDSGDPAVDITLPLDWPRGARTVVRVNLRFLVEVLSGLRGDDGSEIFIVDGQGQLVAHADPLELLRAQSLVDHPVLVAARTALASGAARAEAIDGPGLRGARAVTTAVPMPTTGWLLFVEQAHERAMRPVYATVQRTLLLASVAIALAVLLALAIARRLATPIAVLQRATAQLAAGQLDLKLSLNTNDEIGDLARDFERMADRLRASYAELEQKVAERTAELALRRDEAERASAAKTRFLASASHDLRQPMHAIGLLVDLLQTRLADPAQRALTDKTIQSVQAMESMFSSLLDVSRLDAGGVVPRVGATPLRALVERVAVAYAPLATAKGLSLRVRCAPVVTRTDAALLERIVANLVSNAIRYTGRGGLLLTCRRRPEGLRLSVIDTGVGIPADKLDLVFEEFVRLEAPAPGDKGLGLGLSIVRRTADLLGVAVTVRSRVRRGTAFHVLLPDAGEDSGAQPTGADITGPSVAGAFVLIVDDDEWARETCADLLRAWGCLVITASGCAPALAEVDRHLRAPDLLITDFRLGTGRNGLVLARALRAQVGAAVPVILLTAESPGALPQGEAVMHVQKPAGAVALRAAVSAALTGDASIAS